MKLCWWVLMMKSHFLRIASFLWNAEKPYGLCGTKCPRGRGLPQNDELAVAFLLKAVVRQAGRLGVAMVDGSNNIQVAAMEIYRYGIYWGITYGNQKSKKATIYQPYRYGQLMVESVYLCHINWYSLDRFPINRLENARTKGGLPDMRILFRDKGGIGSICCPECNFPIWF